MKWSKILHTIAAIAAVAGLLSIIGTWVAGQSGTFLGMSQAHLYDDAIVFLLASIAFGVGTLIHNLESRRS